MRMYACSNGPGRTTTSRCANPSRSLLVAGACSTSSRDADTDSCLETGIMGSISTRRSMRARLRAARRLTTIRSAHPPAPARTGVAVAAPPRSSVSGSRCGVWRRCKREHDADALLLHSRGGVLCRTSDACTQARCANLFYFFSLIRRRL